MHGWSYSGGTRINAAKRTALGMLLALVHYDETNEWWHWSIRVVTKDEVKTIAEGTNPSARLCVECALAYMEG
jgi:hypothetical protein